MSYNGSGTFLINSAGQPVVANTVISATVFNALTSDLATGLSTCITKDGQTTVTANIPFGNNKITSLGAGTAATDASNVSQVQSTAAKLITVTGTDTITGTMSPALTAYAAGQLFYFIANAANTGAMTINIDGLGAKNITRDGSTALIAGDVNTGEIVVICYDGTRFQMINAANSFGNTTINGTLTVTGNTALQANVSITSALSVGGVFAVTGAATLGSTLSVTGKSDLPTVSTASMNAAVAVVTTGTVTNLTSTSASIASMNAGVALLTTATVTTLTATSASIASANIGNLQFTAASIASINAGVAVITNLTATSASIASMNGSVASITTVNATTVDATNVEVTNVKAKDGTAAATIADSTGVVSFTANPILSGGTANGVLYLNGSKVATSGSALVFDGTNLGIGTTSPATNLSVVGTGITDAGGGGAYQVTVDNNAAYNATPQGGIIHRFKWSSAGTLTTGAAIRFYKPNTNDSDASSQIGFLVRSGIAGQSQAMTLDSSGNLGIGTSSPSAKLHVVGSTGIRVDGGSSNTAVLNLSASTTPSNGVTIGSNYDGTGSYGPLNFVTSGTTQMVLNASGNLGLGVTPSAWDAGSKAIEVNSAGHGIWASTNYTDLIQNCIFSGSGYKYAATGTSTRYDMSSGTHSWFTAPSGTAGNAITFTQAMTLDASGNLSVNTTSAIAGAANRGNITIGGSAGSILSLGTSASAYGYLFYDTSNSSMEVWNYSNSFMRFGTNNTERARITAAGDVGIGTTSPSGKVQITGASASRYLTLNAPTDGGYITFEAGGTAFADAGSEKGLLGSGSATNFILSTRSTNNILFATNNTERARITAAGSFVAGASAALTTTATDGFLYVPTCAGTPTGTPTAITGMAPIVIDTTNNKMYFYSGGQWRDAGP